jgi:Flp pilus assembly pilin Flp
MTLSHAQVRLRDREEVKVMTSLRPYLRLRKGEEGQTMAEYAVVLGVITLAVVGVFVALSGGISNALNAVTSAI